MISFLNGTRSAKPQSYSALGDALEVAGFALFRSSKENRSPFGQPPE